MATQLFGFRRSFAEWNGCVEVRGRVGADVHSRWSSGRIADSWVSAIHVIGRHRLLVVCFDSFDCLCVASRISCRRVRARIIWHGRTGNGVLFEPLVHEVSVLGGWLPWRLGLVRILFLRNAG